MSTSLHWRPAKNGASLGYALKKALAPRLWQHDGSLQGEWVTVNRGFIPFLEGVAAGAPGDLREEAEELIGLIEKHGEIELGLLG